MSARAPSPTFDPRYAWLGVVLPAEARRFRTDDPELRSLLAEAGAEPVADGPDVEIAGLSGLRGDASTAVVPFYRAHSDRGPRVLRGARRIGDGLRTRFDLRRATRRAHKLGYRSVSTIAWERSIPVVGLGLPKQPQSPLAHRFPLNALLVAHRDRGARTSFDEAVAAAGRATGQLLHPSRVVFGSSGVVVADLGPVILRLALGPARSRLAAQQRTLEQIRGLDPSGRLTARVPSLVANGKEGLATWALEKRLPGSHPGGLDADLQEDSAEFLAELGRLTVNGSPRERLLSAAYEVGKACAGDRGEEFAQLAANALDELADQPCCFVHGDFWTGNLLVEGNRLSGVIDWPEGGPDGLPMVDALHLQLSWIRQGTREPLGVAVANHLLPAAFSAHGFLQACLQNSNAQLTDREERALVVAYWLGALARELRDPDSQQEGDRARWEGENIDPVLGVLQGARSIGALPESERTASNQD
jgi:hypothetical protein